MRSPFEPEFHEEAADDPRMKLRQRARNMLLIGAAALIPVSALMLIITLIVWKSYPDLPSGIWFSAMLHPCLSALLVLVGGYFLRQGFYQIAMACILAPAINIGAFIYLFWDWL